MDEAAEIISGPVTAIEMLKLSESAPAPFAARLRRAADQIAGVQSPLDGVWRIAAERMRQIHDEGHLQVSDVAYVDGQLAMAAVSYAFPISSFTRRDGMVWGTPPETWPWLKEAWKPAPVLDNGEGDATVRIAQRLRELEKAGALIAAEIDRLVRRQADGEQFA